MPIIETLKSLSLTSWIVVAVVAFMFIIIFKIFWKTLKALLKFAAVIAVLGLILWLMFKYVI